jgi:hypothetical protein
MGSERNYSANMLSTFDYGLSPPGNEPPLPPRANSRTLSESIRDVVLRALVHAGAGPGMMPERRKEKRTLFPYPVLMTPVDRDGVTPIGKSFSVLGKHIADHGFDFYSHDPVPYRRMIASFDTARGQVMALLMDVSWCRFGTHGWYENGGRFLEQTTPPVIGDGR